VLSQASQTTPYRLEGLELASGLVLGFDDVPMPPDDARRPRHVLEDLLRECLQAAPCMVAFSGGRDSSAILAVAVHVARRDGLPLPIPLTLRYPHAAQTDECDWQHLVLDHLGLGNQEVVTVGHEHNPIGPYAAPVLRRHGAIWPMNFAPTWRMLDTARGGTLVTGEGGDDMFGRRRLTPWVGVARSLGSGRLPGRGDLRAGAGELLPAGVRHRRAVARSRGITSWLREEALHAVVDRAAADGLSYARHAGTHTRQLVTHRAMRRLIDSLQALGAEVGTSYRAPFCEPAFAASLGRSLTRFGPTNRTESMSRLFADLVPPRVMARPDKGVYNNAVFTDELQAFAASWDGSGVDPTLVDTEALRTSWRSGHVHPLTIGLLQAVWLTTARSAGCR
jgi:Asparagine synthase